jgi:hypothetical protein
MIGGSHVESDIHRRLLMHELGTVKIADFGLSKSLKLNKGGDPGDTPEGSRQGGTAASGEDDSAQPRHQQQKKQGHSYKLTGETGSYRCGNFMHCCLCIYVYYNLQRKRLVELLQQVQRAWGVMCLYIPGRVSMLHQLRLSASRHSICKL